MEENSETHMETDVSSTTDDVPESQQVTGSHGDVEMVIVVEKLKEEEDTFNDPELEHRQGQNISSAITVVGTSPIKDRTPQKIVIKTPVKEYSGPRSLLKSSVKCDSIKTLNKDSILAPVKENYELQRPESADSSTKTDTIIISPSKTSTDINCIKISQIQMNNKSPLKQIKLVRRPPVTVPNLQDKPSIQVVNSQVTSPSKVIAENKEVTVVEKNKIEIITSPKNDVCVQGKSNKDVQLKSPTEEETIKFPSQCTETQKVCNNNIEGSQEKTKIENEAQDTNTANKDATSVIVNSSKITNTCITDIETVITTKNPVTNNGTINTVEGPSTDKETMKATKCPISDNETDKAAKGPENEIIEAAEAPTVKTSDITTAVPEEVEKDSQNDSQMSDTTEKDHNRSISRELKSLINSAKESKIISECTQLTSKTRKSRSHIDSPNTSLNVSEGEKLGNRRGSTNSQISNSSEKSDRVSLKRSMRSQNPEFVNKCKQFLNSVTSKGTREIHEPMSEDESDIKGKEKAEVNTDKHTDLPISPKRKKAAQPILEKNDKVGKLRCDPYCWRCHWIVEQEDNDKSHPPMQCTVCPRSYHYKCLSAIERKTSTENTKNWVCPDCLQILAAESSETRSPAMKKISLGMLCVLLKHAVDRMMELNGAEPFIQPVDRTAFPDYDKYIVHPMDLTQMKKNIEDSHYGSTEAFVADAQWILHNSIIFNTLQSKLSGGARALVRSCKTEMGEIEACPECYAAAHAHRPTWFTDVCSTPHILLWAKLKGFPYWPAKGMTVNGSGLVDVRFFGAHDRAWVPAKDCFLFSEKDPNSFRSKRQDILDSMMEAEQHIRNISRKYGKFVYPPFKTQFEPSQLSEQLKMMIPNFEGDIAVREKPVTASPLSKEKKRSNSKSSKSSTNDGEASETEDTSMTSQKTLKVEKENSADKDELLEVDTPKIPRKQVETIPTRKRRRSNLEEAVLTIMNTSSTEKKKKAENHTEQKKSEPEQANSKVEKQVPSSVCKKEPEASEANTKKKTDTPKGKSKDEEPSSSTFEEKESQRVTPIKLVALPRTNKQTPKMFTTTKVTSKPSTPKEEDKTPQKTKTTRSDKTPITEEKDKTQHEKRRNSRTNKSTNNSPRVVKPIEKKAETVNEPTSSNEVREKGVKESKKKEVKETVSEADQSAAANNVSKTNDHPKTAKDRLHFDDDTSLAVIARKTRNSSCLPTISNVCSLSTTAQATSTTITQTTIASNSTEITVEANSDSSIFTPTSTDSVSNMKDAVSKLQKLRENEPVVGRVGVKAFARMTSPGRTNDNVQVEIKAEPIDLDEGDEDRLNEKMDLMNACKLQPVNQAQSLRDVRINRVVVGPSYVVKKTGKPEARPRAKKTFPQPRRVEENRSELNGKNSMVYIPIQPPMTPVPLRPGPRPIHPYIRPVLPNAYGNKTVNTITTPLKPTTATITSPSIAPSTTTAGQIGVPTTGQIGAPTAGQIGGPTVGQVPTTVHTVPLMTSVNGQWMFSLQPVMSVGGVDNTNSQAIVNGLPERGATPALLPLSATNSGPSTPAQAKRTTTDAGTPSELPRLQQRPPLVNPLDPSSPAGPLPPPAAAGPVSAKLNQNAVKIADFFRTLLEDSIERFDDPLAAATSFRLQLEQARWRHQQELEEAKHNHELLLAEMRLTFEKEKQRAVTEARRVAQVELDNAVKVAKTKQWCANCNQEAQFYCCWNTAYCDYPCQRAHWPQHFAACAQGPKTAKTNAEREENSPGELKYNLFGLIIPEKKKKQRKKKKNVVPISQATDAEQRKRRLQWQAANKRRAQRRKDGHEDSSANTPESRLQTQPDNLPKSVPAQTPALTVGGKLAATRMFPGTEATQQPKASIIVSMMEDNSGNQTVKCVGTYKSNQSQAQLSPIILNKQVITDETGKKVVTSGGYLIVGATSNTTSVVTPAPTRRSHIQYFTT